MIVELSCSQCWDTDEEGDTVDSTPMIPIGPLTISEEKTQSQEYKCPKCSIMVRITINTWKDK